MTEHPHTIEIKELQLNALLEITQAINKTCRKNLFIKYTTSHCDQI
jgi:hypothetical protein